VLYCPQCGAEYREGYSSCSDCHVLLVHEPPPSRQESLPEPGDPNRDPFCAFWEGDDPRVHAELCEVLDEAGIPHKTVYRKDHLFNLANYPSFQIGVPASRFEDSENAVREAFGTEEGRSALEELQASPKLLPSNENRIRKLPEMLAPQESIPGPESPGDSADWLEEDATALVWSGEDAYRASAILGALNENDLHVRREMQNNATNLFVFPAEESRAREIIREMVESTPPE
jgi:hypothetical protein